MPSALEARLAAFLTREPATRVMNGSANWAKNGFGRALKEVRSLIVHVTAGWPPREKVEEFVTQYIGPPADPTNRHKAGIGTQYFLSGDGTVLQTIDDMPRLTWHATTHSLWAIGVETGNLGHGKGQTRAQDVMPQTLPIDPTKETDHRWRAVGPDPDLHASDIGGIKLWLSLHAFREVLLSWWTTRTYNGPAREPVGDTPWMLFTEWQYRSWALLARDLCERYDLPRNFPVLPHALRSRTITESSTFRRIVLADERFPMMVHSLSRFNIGDAHFEPDIGSEAALQDIYSAKAIEAHGRQNPIWDALFETYRGIHGHGFSGYAGDDHDCPGPLFDWHRFAREVWDWWWYPFDFTADQSAGERARRPERKANGTTPLVEYYFEAKNDNDFDAKHAAYLARAGVPFGSRPPGIFDNLSSPSVFFLEQRVPVYAPANGELVAARFPLVDPRYPVSLAFVLVRHEIFHRPNTLLPAHPERIDYNQKPGYVYSLVMHLGRPDGMSFDTVTDANPDWLNRVLIRKKECDLALARHATPQTGDPAKTTWDSAPPGGRPSLLQGLVGDRAQLQTFLGALRAGEVALAPWPTGMFAGSPIRIILGDFLGESGVIRSEGGRLQFGIGMEVFSSGFVPPTFRVYPSEQWPPPPPPLTLAEPACFLYQSEWAKEPTMPERQRLEAIGVNPNLVSWWRPVALRTQLDPRLPLDAQLINPGGTVYHIRPLDFMRWINAVTWASEWPKYKVRNPDGTEAARPTRPRSRRV